MSENIVNGIIYPGSSGTEYHIESTADQELLDAVASAEAAADRAESAASMFDEDVQGYVDEWLDEHPEATTTVQDGSITYAKLNESLQTFVTPEMFGAVGNGIADDTEAWQTAVDSGLNVIATSLKYKCGTITVTKNINIDCNNAEFICTDNILFNCHGEVVESLTNESDYTANNGFSISNNNYSNYFGMALFRGNNNFEESRDYYKGGFVCEFNDGKLASSYPIDVVNNIIDIINPIRVSLKRIGKIIHTGEITSSVSSIYILYGSCCSVADSEMENSNGYNVINFEKCLNCIVDNIKINRLVTTSNANQSYLITLNDSSFCSIINSYLVNYYWHCITTGNIYLCYHNIIDKCTLTSMLQFAYCDHNNALNTIIENSKCTGIMVSGMSIVNNCVVNAVIDSTYKICQLALIPVSIMDNAIYTVRNIVILSESSASAPDVGIEFKNSPVATGKTYYIKKATIDNVKCIGISAGGRLSFDFNANSNYIIYDIYVNNVNLSIFLSITSAQTNVDISNYLLLITNIAEKSGSYYPYLGYTSQIFNNVIVKNCHFYQVYGTFNNLTLEDIYSENYIDSVSVSNELNGGGIMARLTLAMLAVPSYVNIKDFKWDTGSYYFNVSGKKGNGIYGWRWNAGAMQAIALVQPS